jgi:hypothetical protein
MRLATEYRQSGWFQRGGMPFLIFWLAFLPRAIYPVFWPMQWYNRAVHFGDALLSQNWAGTYQRYHPGVTTMWLSGIALKLFAWQRGLSSDQVLGLAPTQPGTMNDAATAGVLPLALVIALCIALAYVLLNRITTRKIALAGACLLALDPFHITYSKALHVDALLATFMLVSVLFLLNHVYRARRLDLVMSGVFAGLAFLSKSPSLFLVPYTALAVGVYRLTECRTEARTRNQAWAHWFWSCCLRDWIRALLIWSGIAALVFVVLWPAMWVEPLDAMVKMARRIVFHVETAHRNPVFFNGQATLGDPGLPFYLATIALKTTWVTLPMAGVAIVLALFRFRQSRHSRITCWFVVYAVCFTMQMGLSARKELAYLLPVFPGLDIVAAVGLIQSAQAVGRLRWWRHRPWPPVAFVALALTLQACTVLSHHPYYGTHHNILLGGSKTAQRILPLQDQGEGLDLAAQYLNTLPRAQRARAWLHQRSAAIFRRNFVGLTNTASDPQADYRVYYVNQVMRRLGDEEWGEMWNADRQTAPLWSVAFDGVPYVWVYGAPPEEPAAGGPEYKAHYQFGEHIQLEQFRLSDETLSPGDALTLVLIWRSDGNVEVSYQVFCHIMSEDGELVAQQDGIPLNGVRPTPSWRAGEMIEDSYDILLDRNLAPGEYELTIGMYDAETMERLPAYTMAGEHLIEDRIALGALRVEAATASGE